MAQNSLMIGSVQFSHSVVSNSLRPHGLQHARLSCPSPTPRACANSCPLSQWCHPTISSSVICFSSCLHYFPASGSFIMSWFFTSGGQSIGVSALAQFSSVQSFSPVRLSATWWIAARQASLSITISQSSGVCKVYLVDLKKKKKWALLSRFLIYYVIITIVTK